MIFLNNYNWVELYIDNDSLWLDTIISWEESSTTFSSEFLLIDLIFDVSFNSQYVYIFSSAMFSLFDKLITNYYMSAEYSLFTYKFLLLDVYYSTVNFIFKTILHNNLGYNDYLTTYSYYNYEVIQTLANTVNRNNLTSFLFEEYLLNDFYLTTYDFLYVDIANYLRWVVITLIAVNVILVNLKKVLFGNELSLYKTRVYYYFYSLACEFRVNFDLMSFFFFFATFYWIYSLLTYNDSSVEGIELFHFFIFYFFVFLICYLLFKYSTHYFSFLEPSVSEGKSVMFIAKQFVRDISNTFALFLRFFLLLFRLNIYDGLDDFLDSYYIFFCDFDEDVYFDEVFFNFDDTIFFDDDNEDDSDLFDDDEIDMWEDFFEKYYVIWGNFFMYWFFILEGAFRITLALYITYLIIFEVHSVNFSYNEENYLHIKKINIV